MQTRLALATIPDLDWVQARADIHYVTHGLHHYPARMIPQIASQLINSLSSPGDLVLDPFCGSGGVLVESMLTGRDSVGIDINPLACVLARVKTTPMDPKKLMKTWVSLRNAIDLAARFERRKIETPNFGDVNISYWFKPKTVEELTLIKTFIDRIPDNAQREFFLVCFSATVRLVSGQRGGEFKLYRIPEEDWKKHNPDTLGIFSERVNRNISKMGEFFQALEHRKRVVAEVIEADTRHLLTDKFPECKSNLTRGSVDLVVTSPPYGDSHTTVAYGQFSKHALLWLGYTNERALEVDKQSIGGRHNGVKLESTTLDRTLEKVVDRKRAEEVCDFFVDLLRCLEKISDVLRKGGYACFVLGNRTVSRVKIPSDRILAKIGKQLGLEQKLIIQREIPSKRIPWKSSPSNIPGDKVGTISKESIIILEKQ